ncbi:hypothetical protein HK101_011879, partial [Irineochytrium annulatum]
PIIHHRTSSRPENQYDVRPTTPQKPLISTLSTHGRPSDLPDEAVAHLSRILGRDIDVRDLFARLERTRENAEAWERGVRGDGVHDPKVDLSRHLFHGHDAAYDQTSEGRPKAISFRKKAAVAFRKAIGVAVDHDGSPLPHDQQNGQGGGVGHHHVRESDLPPVPVGIHKEDYLSLAIHYHEREMLDVSAYYMEKSGEERNPLGLYLLGLALRHGWGVDEDKERAFRCLLLSVESSLMTIPEIAARRTHSNENADSPSSGSVNDTTGKTKRPSDLRSLRSYASVANVMASDIDTAIALLPLPLFEVAMCFRQGWGVLKSYPAAVYYFGIAARLGDADAMYELGYCYLNGTGITKDKDAKNKILAATWLREADKNGRKVTGESWIWKVRIAFACKNSVDAKFIIVGKI